MNEDEARVLFDIDECSTDEEEGKVLDPLFRNHSS